MPLIIDISYLNSVKYVIIVVFVCLFIADLYLYGIPINLLNE